MICFKKKEIYIYILIIFTTIFFSSEGVIGMQSTNYKIEKDSINFGGTDNGQSNNYKLKDTMGEIGTGGSTSDNYQMNAGYRQMDEFHISISVPLDVTMNPAIGGVSGGTGNGQATWTVITDNPAGYSVSIKASASPALASGGDSFADYTPASAGVPDYSWSIANNDSEFGFTPEGTDIVAKFKDNGVDTCNSGSNDTTDKCWYNFSTSSEDISNSTSANHPSGTNTTIKFRSQSGSSHIQKNGSYTATITMTAVML